MPPSLRINPTFVSLMAAILAFGIDRAHKHAQIAAECMALSAAPCVTDFIPFTPFSLSAWRGGEVVQVTSFFDYLLVWNKGVSYGLLDGLPGGSLGLVLLAALAILVVWWIRAPAPATRLGLALCIGGALSNLVDRLIYGAVADFFHFHIGTWSFYIFNLADVAITLGVIVLLVDLTGLAKPRRPQS